MLLKEQLFRCQTVQATTQRGDITMAISSPSTQQGEIYQNFIGGEWRNSRGSETFTSTNPAHTSEIIGRYQRSNDL